MKDAKCPNCGTSVDLPYSKKMGDVIVYFNPWCPKCGKPVAVKEKIDSFLSKGGDIK